MKVVARRMADKYSFVSVNNKMGFAITNTVNEGYSLVHYHLRFESC